MTGEKIAVTQHADGKSFSATDGPVTITVKSIRRVRGMLSCWITASTGEQSLVDTINLSTARTRAQFRAEAQAKGITVRDVVLQALLTAAEEVEAERKGKPSVVPTAAPPGIPPPMSAPPLAGLPSGPQSAVLVSLMDDCTLFHDPDKEPYITLPVHGHTETHRLLTKPVRRFLAQRYYALEGKSPGSQALQAALNTLAGKAMFDGAEHAVHVRLAEHDGMFYLDLANLQWQVVRIATTGWDIIAAADSPVRFRRPKGMLALPVPVRGGTLDALKPFVTVTGDQWTLLIAWLVAALRPHGPYWVLAVTGEQGSAKSTLLRLLRALIDPNDAPIRSPPRDERDLVIAATNGWLPCFDNASSIAVWLSDATCRLATGGGFATRALFENDEETIFNATRPVCVNGIEDVVNRGDLADRAIALVLPRIAEEQRKTERALWQAFERERPAILGALLDAVSGALRNLPTAHLDRLPRMADCALWVVAAERALDWTPGTFMQAYTTNRAEASTLVLEDSPVAQGIFALMEEREEWEGSASALLAVLTDGMDDRMRQREGWPKKANGLSGTLRRLAPSLRAAGVEVSFGREAHTGKRIIALWAREREPETSSPPSPSSPDGRFARNDEGDQGDDRAPGDDDGRHSLPSSSPQNSTPGNGKPVGGDDGDDGDDDLRFHSKVDGHPTHVPADRACLVRSWAERVAAGVAEGQEIPAVVVRFSQQHAIPLDPFALRRTGQAVLQALRTMKTAKEGQGGHDA
jgi:hypothetical protein